MPQSPPAKPAIYSWLLRQDLTGIHNSLTLVQQAAVACLNKNAMDAASYATANHVAVWNHVLRQEQEQQNRGILPCLAVADAASKTWHAHPIPSLASTSLRGKYLRTRYRPRMLRMIDASSDREYEALSCVLLEALGAGRVNLTRRGNEGGVDAFGVISLPNASHLLSSTFHPLKLVVQAKKYSTAVSPDKIKEFIQTLNEVKHGGQPKTEEIIPAWFRASNGPIIGVVVAHSGFQSGAATRARMHGIVLVDSVDLAEVLSVTRRLYGTDMSLREGAIHARVDSLLAGV